MSPDYGRFHPNTREILVSAECEAQDAGQTEIDTTHLMHACLKSEDIREWLRRLQIPIETAKLLNSLKIPNKPDESELDPLMMAFLYLANPPSETEQLTDKARNAMVYSIREVPKFGGYYIHPIHILSGIIQADEPLIEHTLLGFGQNLTREKLLEEVIKEEQRARLSETTDKLKRFMETGKDFTTKLHIAEQIDQLIE